MKVYVRPRQGGKTQELIKLAAEERLVIVCVTLEMVSVVKDRAKKMGLDIPEPLSWQQFAGGRHRGRRIKGFVIDDVDEGLRQLARTVPVEAVSLTGVNMDAGGWPVADAALGAG